MTDTWCLGACWGYWQWLGTIDADWEQWDLIFYEDDQVEVHTVRMRRFRKKKRP